MTINIKPDSFKLLLLYFATAILLFTTGNNTLNIIKINVNTSVSFIVIIVILFVIFLLQFPDYKVDIIFVLMTVRWILFSFGLFYHANSGDNITRYISTALWPLIYVISISRFNVLNSKKRILMFAKIVSYIISIQTIFVSIRTMGEGINLAYIKNYIRIPLAPSNTITCYLLLLIPYLYYLQDNKSNLFSLGLPTVAIIMTRSFSGIIFLAIFILFIIFNNKREVFKRLIFALIALAAIYFVIIHYVPNFFERYITRLSVIRFEAGTVNDTFNGRFEIYTQALKLIKEHPFLGYGISYGELLPGNNLAHNWIFESFLQEGLLNFALVSLIFMKVGKILYRDKSSISKAALMSFVIVILQALVEPSITAFPFDYFLWILTSSSVGIIYNRENSPLKTI